LKISQLIQEGNKFREVNKESVREEYVAWATEVALYTEIKYTQTSIADKSKYTSHQLFMAGKVEEKYADLMGILEAIRRYEMNND
jgi:hypothetical protein